MKIWRLFARLVLVLSRITGLQGTNNAIGRTWVIPPAIKNSLVRLSFQISRLLSRGDTTTVRLNEAVFTFRTMDTSIYWTMLAGNYEPISLLIWTRLSKLGGTMVDVGANIGVYSVLAALQGANVEAFEPEPTNLTFLKTNLLNNNCLDRVHIHACAVGSSNGVQKLQLSENSGLHSLKRDVVRQATLELDVNVCSLDYALADHSSPTNRIVAIKVDTEGFETEVLRGSSSIIQRFKPVWMVEYWRQGLPTELEVIQFEEQLRMAGDYIYAVEENRSRLVKVERSLVEFPRDYLGNLLVCSSNHLELFHDLLA